jgi:hypothetical protein
MKSTVIGLIVCTLCTIFGATSPRTSAAVSYVPHNLIEQPTTDTTIYKRPGAIVYLFHGTTAEIIQPLIGKVFSVYRESVAGSPAGKFKVGNIRLTKSSGDNHVEAVVVEGELKGGDIAHLGEINGLVVLTKEHCETLKQTDHEPRK